MKNVQFPLVLKNLVVFSFYLLAVMNIHAQPQKMYSLKGQLEDMKSSQPVSFATVALKKLPGSALIKGISSDENGKFSLESIPAGKYEMIVSAIGFETITKGVDLSEDTDAGTLLLQEKSVSLSEIVISGERKKAQSGIEKTTWLINQKMQESSATGTELLSHIPGISVDLMKNISLAGSQNIIITVDGKEREKSYLSQLEASAIDKIEVINNPGSRYDAGVTGVLNIILKNDRKTGLNGYVNAEIPTSSREIYLFPSFSLSYGKGKINLYTSYNGELAYFDIVEKTDRSFQDLTGMTSIHSEQDVRQKNWSHKFHYGFDYILDDRNKFNFYAYNNPWSRELDGTTVFSTEKDSSLTSFQKGYKNDSDLNNSSFYSVYYKHDFAGQETALEFDLSNYHYKAETGTEYFISSQDQENYKSGKLMPGQNSIVMRIDFGASLSEELRLSSGIKARNQVMLDRMNEFRYEENLLAMYGSLTYSKSKFTVKTGLRAERLSSDLSDSFNNRVFSILPDAAVNYKLSSKNSFSLSYSRTVSNPRLNELNPNIVVTDPFAVITGNPGLKPEFFRKLDLRYSGTYGNNYFSAQLYYRKRNDAINNYTFINQAGIFETRVANLGSIQAYGVELTGAIRLLKIVSVNPYMNLYDLHTSGNSIASHYGISNREKVCFETGISATANFRYDIIASFRFHYSTPSTDLQTITFGDALYFISLEKSFLKKYKFSISSALPFSRSFTYQGYRTTGMALNSRTSGDIQLSSIPLWFTLRYQFSSGKKINRIDRTREEISNVTKKGF